MPRFNQFIAAGAILGYPLLCHAAVAFGEPRWAALGLVLLAWVTVRAWRGALASVFAVVVLLAVATAVIAVAPTAIVYVPPIALNLALCALFARSLRSGSEPMITRFARLERAGDMPDELATYTRRLTQLWTVFFVLMAAISLSLALWASPAAWSLFTNLVNYALVLLMFVLEYAYRRIRYRHYRHAGVMEFLRRLPRYRISGRADGSSI